MALFRKKRAGKPGEWYYCLEHGRVEEGPQCRALNRLGPYATPEEAGRAIETAEARNEEWDEDARWNDDAGGAGGEGGSGR
ncbi:hypothetical protein O7599_30095 [Streptomyces sp. WMMC500]|uniref:hypothetical protein n=1 Tax=Streptomyces sp. WMMC500 TaxID=3015154 RepID=UPI00248B1B9A|nr:hypothetical protein [Streptomyces sp. WMMC500]WBB59761.1 hypothetical protein O7599_30095 [Streptomyces sp. WMMC500]